MFNALTFWICTTTPVSTAFLNPGADAVTSYVPSGSSGNRYTPALVDTVVVTTPVSWFFAVMVAPAMAAPLGSATVPASTPRTDCAERVPGTHTKTHKNERNRETSRIFTPRGKEAALGLRRAEHPPNARDTQKLRPRGPQHGRAEIMKALSLRVNPVITG